MIESSDVSKLVRTALEEFEIVDLSASVRRAFRIARLQGDGEQAWLFDAELAPIGGSKAVRLSEVSAMFLSKEGVDLYSKNKELREIWLAERTPQVPKPLLEFEDIKQGHVLIGSIDELEKDQDRYESEAKTYVGLERTYIQLRADMSGQLLARIKGRAYGYLCKIENQLLISEASFDIYSARKQRVDRYLKDLAPEVFDQFNVAFRRAIEGGAEANSHALLSCRRIIEAVADVVSPASSTPDIDQDGKSHGLIQSMYINRLIKYLKSTSTGKALISSMTSNLEEIAARMATLDALANKGVHSDASSREVEWCVIQTYLLVGDILELHADIAIQ